AQMGDEDTPISKEDLERELAFGLEDPTALTANQRAFTIMVRNLMWRLVELFAWEKEDRLADLLDYLERDEKPDWGAELDAYFDEYADLDIGADARGGDYFSLTRDGREWTARQIIKDPEGDNSFQLVAVVDLDASDAEGEVRLKNLEMIRS
ncbi:MAG TPA: DUF3516 domain-containing protein, partial [Corynebacterium sp.]|nr:DUF3516 domain-containing protein [Corynebacterium sp.]